MEMDNFCWRLESQEVEYWFELIYVVCLIIIFNQYIYIFNLQLLLAHRFICLEHPVSRDVNGAQLIYKVWLPHSLAHYNMSIYGFSGMLSWLYFINLSFESSNDLQMTSSDLQWPVNRTIWPNLTLGHVMFLFIDFWNTASIAPITFWIWNHLNTLPFNQISIRYMFMSFYTGC